MDNNDKDVNNAPSYSTGQLTTDDKLDDLSRYIDKTKKMENAHRSLMDRLEWILTEHDLGYAVHEDYLELKGRVEDAFNEAKEEMLNIYGEPHTEELKPCPFCGKRAIKGTVMCVHMREYAIGCNTEECLGNICSMPRFTKHEVALTRWNTRIPGFMV